MSFLNSLKKENKNEQQPENVWSPIFKQIGIKYRPETSLNVWVQADVLDPVCKSLPTNEDEFDKLRNTYWKEYKKDLEYEKMTEEEKLNLDSKWRNKLRKVNLEDFQSYCKELNKPLIVKETKKNVVDQKHFGKVPVTIKCSDENKGINCSYTAESTLAFDEDVRKAQLQIETSIKDAQIERKAVIDSLRSLREQNTNATNSKDSTSSSLPSKVVLIVNIFLTGHKTHLNSFATISNNKDTNMVTSFSHGVWRTVIGNINTALQRVSQNENAEREQFFNKLKDFFQQIENQQIDRSIINNECDKINISAFLKAFLDIISSDSFRKFDRMVLQRTSSDVIDRFTKSFTSQLSAFNNDAERLNTFEIVQSCFVIFIQVVNYMNNDNEYTHNEELNKVSLSALGSFIIDNTLSPTAPKKIFFIFFAKILTICVNHNRFFTKVRSNETLQEIRTKLSKMSALMSDKNGNFQTLLGTFKTFPDLCMSINTQVSLSETNNQVRKNITTIIEKAGELENLVDDNGGVNLSDDENKNIQSYKISNLLPKCDKLPRQFTKAFHFLKLIEFAVKYFSRAFEESNPTLKLQGKATNKEISPAVITGKKSKRNIDWSSQPTGTVVGGGNQKQKTIKAAEKKKKKESKKNVTLKNVVQRRRCA